MTLHQRKFFPLISLFVDGELKESARQRLEEHIESCDECKQALQDFRRLREIGSHSKGFSVNPYYLTRVRAAIDRKPAPAPDASVIEARLLIPVLGVLVTVLVILFSISEPEKPLASDDYLFEGRKTLLEQQFLSRERAFSKDEVLLLSVSTHRGEEPNGR